MSESAAVKQDVEQGKDILESDPFEGRDLFWEQHRFARDGYLKINHLIDPEVRDRISDDVKYLLANFSKRRDFLIESTGNTPRYLSNVPQESIEAPWALYPACLPISLPDEFDWSYRQGGNYPNTMEMG